MRIIYKKTNKELLEKVNTMHPGFASEVNDVYEYEVHWWHREWWSLKWYALIIQLCEWAVPSLKDEDPQVKIK